MDLIKAYNEINAYLESECRLIEQHRQRSKDREEAILNDYRRAIDGIDEKMVSLEEHKKQIEAYKRSLGRRYIGEGLHATPRRIDAHYMMRLFSSENYEDLSIEIVGQLLTVEKEESLAIEEKNLKKKQYIDRINQEKADLGRKIDIVKSSVVTYLLGATYSNFISSIKKTMARCDFSKDECESSTDSSVYIGMSSMPLIVDESFAKEITEYSDGLADREKKIIYVPYEVKLENEVILAEYSNETEKTLLSGVQSLFLNLAKHHKGQYKQAVFVDPVRYNSSGLGCASMLCEDEDSFIHRVPASNEDVNRLINLIIDIFNNEERSENKEEAKNEGKEVFVFHNFPQGYDERIKNAIKQLCANATNYGILVVLTTNTSSRTSSYYDILSEISFGARVIKLGADNCFYVNDNTATFKWIEAPTVIPSSIEKAYAKEKETLNKSSLYLDHFDFDTFPMYNKGNKSIRQIPYGVDRKGRVLYLDFEDSNFATFICGASRCGKSTLLHTIITGILRSTHPDDVEMWLIDFKMTEFSRYIKHTPPHVRYIVLDESPELVYDIIDKLTKIMRYRQNAYKGRWEKLSDVPKERYMPSMFIIIDEFSVMSQIIAESALNGSDNYQVKLQTLLAKGAALGMHFIFASQGFTTGTRGLNDFAKKQVQQRIAMRTDVAEIKETLDLRSPGADDTARMEGLPVHHTLVKSRVPVDVSGNYLLYSKTLYIDDTEKQLEYIDRLKLTLYPVEKFEHDNNDSYIDKESTVIDGNKYSSYNEGAAIFIKHMKANPPEEEEIAALIGEPRRLMSCAPAVFDTDYNENMVIIGMHGESEAMSSVVLSLTKSLGISSVPVTFIASRKNKVYKCLKNYEEAITDIDQICSLVKELKSKIENGIYSNEFYTVMGLESIYTEMMYASTAPKKQPQDAEAEKPKMDVLTFLTLYEEGKMTEPPEHLRGDGLTKKEEPTSNAYDARKDFEFVLVHGPRFGYHFVLTYDSVGSYKQNKLNIAVFNHRIFFRNAKSELIELVGSKNAEAISLLPDHCFRYMRGLNCLSYRPYLHSGIEIDGWNVDEYGNVIIVDDEDNYLI